MISRSQSPQPGGLDRQGKLPLVCTAAIHEKVLGPEHPGLAIDLNSLALLYSATGRFAEAEPLYQRVLAIIEKTLPPDHPHLMRVRENYASLLDQLGRPAEAAELRTQAQRRSGNGARRGSRPTERHWPKLEDLRRAALLRQIRWQDAAAFGPPHRRKRRR